MDYASAGLSLYVICVFGAWTYFKAFEVSAGIEIPTTKRMIASLTWFIAPFYISGLLAIAAKLKELEDEDNG